MKTLLKSAFILALTAMVISCDFYGKGPEVGKVEKPATEIPGDSVGEQNKAEEKEKIDSAAVPNDSLTESEEKKEAK